MENTEVIIQTNKYQTPVTQKLLDSLPSEVAEQLIDCLTNIQFIKNLIRYLLRWIIKKWRNKE